MRSSINSGNVFFPILIGALLVLAPSVAFSSKASDALIAIRKLQSKCQAGISYSAYGDAHGDEKASVNEFLESKEATDNPKFTEIIRKIDENYQTAGDMWALKVNSDDMEYVMADSWLRFFPNAKPYIYHLGDKDVIFFANFLSAIWEAASEKTAIASAILKESEMVKDQTSAIALGASVDSNNALLEQENNDLKNKVFNLNKEIEKLKRQKYKDCAK